MGMGENAILGSAYGDLAHLTASEAFRHIDVTAPIRAKLPFAAAPSISLSDNPKAVESGEKAFKEATAVTLKDIQRQVDNLDATDEQRAAA
jgi:hypothetical protein